MGERWLLDSVGGWVYFGVGQNMGGMGRGRGGMVSGRDSDHHGGRVWCGEGRRRDGVWKGVCPW